MHAFDEMTEPELRDLFLEVSAALVEKLPEGTGFILFSAPLNKQHSLTQFTSNVDRQCAVEWMNDVLTRWKSGDIVMRD